MQAYHCIAKLENKYSVDYGSTSPEFINQSLPEALAECWLWLKKEGLIK